jgi:hypothetical protein
MTSSLLAFPVFEPEALPAERADWWALRAQHLAEIRGWFDSVSSGERLLLFLHDPTAMPYLAELREVRARLPQVEMTIIGHLHSPWVLWKSRVLAGMPSIPFLGNTVRRLSQALRRAGDWEPFRVRLCPSLAGIQLLRVGGYLELTSGSEARDPLILRTHRLPW